MAEALTLEHACPSGYTYDEIRAITGADFPAFERFMYGQTQMICEGRKYNHETREYEATECAAAPHGIVTYPWDLERFLNSMKRKK